MASIGDSSAALEVMRDANNDFLAFIRNLRAFLVKSGPITFDIGSGITVSSIQDIISDYRKGIFNEVLIGGQQNGRQVWLHVDDSGNLVVSDVNGNLAQVLCAGVSTADINQCTVDDVLATRCQIDSITGSVSVTGGEVVLNRLSIGDLNTETLEALSMEVGQMRVTGELSCPKILSYGSRKFVPKTTRNVFYRRGGALNNAASLMEFASNGDWIMTEWYDGSYHYNSLKPIDLGFNSGDMARRPPIGNTVPDMIRVYGNNRFDSFTRRGGLLNMSSVPIVTPPNVLACVTGTTGGAFTELPISGAPDFASVLMWPTGFTPAIQQGSGKLYVTSFAPEDIGKEIYYEVRENRWTIYRVMRVQYDAADNTKPVRVEFDVRVTLPEFSCARYIAKVHDSLTDSSVSVGSYSRVVVYALE